MAPLDDSYEFFGGGFDIDHLVAFETADDMSTCRKAGPAAMQLLDRHQTRTS